MVQKADIQYVTQFYSYGSEARVLELKPAQKKQKKALPIAKPEQKIQIAVDPVALAGILIAVAMVIVMAISVHGYLETCDDLLKAISMYQRAGFTLAKETPNDAWRAGLKEQEYILKL